jgi:ABC-2 type transport system permease protein
MGIQYTLIYRVRYLVWMLYDLLVPFLMIIFFKTIIQEPTQQINGLSLENLITYYLLISFFNSTLTSHTNVDMERIIKSGQVSHTLIKPFSFFKKQFAHEAGYKIPATFLILFIVIPLFLLFGQYFKLKLTLLTFGLTLFILFLSFFINFLISFIVGLLSFWFEDIVGFTSLKEVILLLFSGAVLPLEFFPNALSQINNFLPFKYLLYFPIQIIQGRILLPSIFFGLSIQLVWALVFLFLYKAFYPKALKHYSAVGG